MEHLDDTQFGARDAASSPTLTPEVRRGERAIAAALLDFAGPIVRFGRDLGRRPLHEMGRP
jgi:hypothetical protein